MGNETSSRKRESGKEGSCNKCTFLNSPKANSCEMCGNVLKIAPGMCSSCTFVNSEDADTCSMCGNEIKSPSSTNGRKIDPKMLESTQKLLKKHSKLLKGEDSKLEPVVFSIAAFQALPNISTDTKKKVNVSYKEASKFIDSIKEIGSMRDRTNTKPVKQFMLSTLISGLPLFSKHPKINKEVMMCMAYVFRKLIDEKDLTRKKNLAIELASAFSACQAVQQRVIYSLFAKLANIEFDFREQMFKALSQYKHRALDQSVLISIGVNADPHWRSACHVEVFQKLGVEVDGYQAALMDKDRRRLQPNQAKKVISSFLSFFSANDFIQEFIADTNQAGGSDKKGVARNFDLQKLYQWASKQDPGVFNKYSIYYDEDTPKDYVSPQPNKDRSILPYLSPKVARKILTLLGICS
ncbi:hypothetical protein AAMO2058_001639700 [Amorphochlora amoebiformis]